MSKKYSRDDMMVDSHYNETTMSRYGVYAYIRKKTGEILYIGKDSNIDKNARHTHHMSPSKRSEQRINAYIQSPAMEGITYSVLAVAKDEQEMANLETMYIMTYKAAGQCKFNKAIDINESMREAIITYLSDPNLFIN